MKSRKNVVLGRSPDNIQCHFVHVHTHTHRSDSNSSVVKYFLVKNKHDSSFLRHFYIKYFDVKLGISTYLSIHIKVTQKKIGELKGTF